MIDALRRGHNVDDAVSGRRETKRTPQGIEREKRRARSARKLSAAGRQGKDGEGCSTGHSPMFSMAPALELGHMPEGGGYPVGFVQAAARLLGCQDLSALVHLCSGTMRAPLTFDLRADVGAAVRADVRWLPIRPASCRWILADPPYGDDYAEELWGLGKQYPTPTVLLRECAAALAPGGRVGLLHHVVPVQVDGLRTVGVWGVSTGPGYRIRAFTVLERPGQLDLLGGAS
jgi:hypothetical protein